MSQIRKTFEEFIYSVVQISEYITGSDLIIFPIGKNLATTRGNVYFKSSIRLEVREAIDFALDNWITGYYYAVYRNDEKLYWYDSQGHPGEPTLQSTHPHHKQIHPDIKYNRVPAPNISFQRENITFLVHELVEQFFRFRDN